MKSNCLFVGPGCLAFLLVASFGVLGEDAVWPGRDWEFVSPADAGMDEALLWTT